MLDLIADLSLRQPSANAVIPLFLTYYALAVLAILPNTFLFRLLLQPVLVWQAWGCVKNVDFAAWLAQLLGLQSDDRINLWNCLFVLGLLVMILRSFEWTFIIKEPVRRYGPTVDQGAPIERRLSISSVLLDAFDLFCNMRGFGWSWSPQPHPRWNTSPPSITSVFASLLFKITVFDTAHSLIQRVCPAVSNNPSGGSLFDPNLSPLPRIASAAFAGICGGVWAYSLVDTTCHIGALVGRVVFRQPASDWPPNSHRPWLSTSIHEFWSFRWHQLFRHVFTVFGARPGGALLGRPGALTGAFAVSGVLHYVALWGIGYGSEFSTIGGFFLLMGIGAAMEVGFKKVTGMRVQGFSGWLWTMMWTLVWGTPMFDGWTRHGMLVGEFFPYQLRPGKALVDAIVSLSRKVVIP